MLDAMTGAVDTAESKVRYCVALLEPLSCIASSMSTGHGPDRHAVTSVKDGNLVTKGAAAKVVEPHLDLLESVFGNSGVP